MKELRKRYSGLRLVHKDELDEPIYLNKGEEVGIVFPKTKGFFGWGLKKRPKDMEVVVSGALEVNPNCWKMIVLKSSIAGEYIVEFEDVKIISVQERVKAKIIVE